MPAGPLHASAVAIGGAGVLLLGPPGAGKSDLALRLIDRGATLVADDRVAVRAEAGRLHLSAPEPLLGRIEMRGVGLVERPAKGAWAVLALNLAAPPERLPAPAIHIVAGIALPWLALAPFAASAPLLVEEAVARLRLARLWEADDSCR